MLQRYAASLWSLWNINARAKYSYTKGLLALPETAVNGLFQRNPHTAKWNTFMDEPFIHLFICCVLQPTKMQSGCQWWSQFQNKCMKIKKNTLNFRRYTIFEFKKFTFQKQNYVINKALGATPMVMIIFPSNLSSDICFWFTAVVWIKLLDFCCSLAHRFPTSLLSIQTSGR